MSHYSYMSPDQQQVHSVCVSPRGNNSVCHGLLASRYQQAGPRRPFLATIAPSTPDDDLMMTLSTDMHTYVQKAATPTLLLVLTAQMGPNKQFTC